jgi:hypothetical protein
VSSPASSDRRLGAADIDGERLLADDVTACSERPLCQILVQMVGRAHVDDVHRLVRQQVLEALVRLLCAELGRGGARALGRRREDTDHGARRCPHGMGMDRSDEAGAGDRRVERHGAAQPIALAGGRSAKSSSAVMRRRLPVRPARAASRRSPVGARSRCNFVRYGTPGSQRGARRGSALGDVLAGCVNSFNPRVIVPGGDPRRRQYLLAGLRGSAGWAA